jgi:hypothetical protein
MWANSKPEKISLSAIPTLSWVARQAIPTTAASTIALLETLPALTTPHNTTGHSNTFIGSWAGLLNTAGVKNTFVGTNSGMNNTVSDNTFIGFEAGYSDSGGHANTFVGSESGRATTGAWNVAVGYLAGHDTTTGNSNIFLGNEARHTNTTGNNNVFIGYQAGYNETGSNKLYISNSSTASPLIWGDFSTPKVQVNGKLTVTGVIEATTAGVKFPDNNIQSTALKGVSDLGATFLGYDAGTNNTGACNSFVGVSAGYSNNISADNSFMGYMAGYANTTGYDNTFIGFKAGNANIGGIYNSFMGSMAGYFNTTGYDNTFVGYSAGYSNIGGRDNTFLGYYAGNSNTAGNANVFLGYSSGSNETASNKLYISNSDTPTPLIWGDFSSRQLKIHGTLITTAAASPSDSRLKKDIAPLKSSLEKIMRLQGVSYEWRTEENPGKGFAKGREIGLIAQDVEVVFPELVYADQEGYKALAYDKMVPVLIEAIKEQQSLIREQEKQNAEKDERIRRLEKTLESMEKLMTIRENHPKAIALK